MIPVMCWMDEFANIGLNEVRPRWPEQLIYTPTADGRLPLVSMKSGLEGRNNPGSDTNELLAIIVSQ